MDIGSGTGSLAGLALGAGLEYLGIEPDSRMYEAARRRYGNLRSIRFLNCRAQVTAEHIGSGDLVVLNGVAHHLDDPEFHAVLASSTDAIGLLICDHLHDVRNMSPLATWLQKNDRGRFIRDYRLFETLSGFDLLAEQRFVIRLFGFPAWPYFCNYYSRHRRPVENIGVRAPIEKRLT